MDDEQQRAFDQMVLSRMKELAPDVFGRAEAEVNLQIQHAQNAHLLERIAELENEEKESES